MHLILTGATGLVGSAVLEAMIKAADVTQITILSRRPVPLADAARSPKVRVLLHRDFAAYDDPALLAQLRGAAGCVWALGVSQTQVPRAEYATITKDYALAAASAFSRLRAEPPPFRFVYVSGEGATQTPGRFSAVFARVKGEAESALAEMAAEGGRGGALRVDAVRPAWVDAAGHEAIAEYVPDRGVLYGAAAAVLRPVVKVGLRGSHSPTPMLGEFLTQLAMGRKDDDGLEASGAFRLGPAWIVPNVAIRKSMGL